VKTALFAAALFCTVVAPALAESRPAVTLASTAPTASAGTAATIYAYVSISRQTMDVLVVRTDGTAEIHNWNVSTGRKGFATPTGNYKPTWLSRNHHSKKYDAPMPFAVFFHGGYAVHATTDLKRLGRPASHGCVRLAKGDAAAFFSLVAKHGRANTEISIVK